MLITTGLALEHLGEMDAARDAFQDAIDHTPSFESYDEPRINLERLNAG